MKQCNGILAIISLLLLSSCVKQGNRDANYSSVCDTVYLVDTIYMEKAVTNDLDGGGNDATFYYYMDAVSNGNVFAEAADSENSYLYRLLFYQHGDLKSLYVEKFKIDISGSRELVYCKKIAPEMFGQTHYDTMPELVEWLSDSEVLLIVNDRDYIFDLDRMQRVE